MNYIEIFGVLSSLVIFVSLAMTNIIKLRLINLIGCILFAFYGFMIGSFSTTFMNIGIALMNIYYLRQLYMKKDSFELVKADRESDYFKLFMEKNAADIDKFFTKGRIEKSDEIYYLLRNNYTAGIIGWRVEGDTVEVTIDYVTDMFRDYKFGKFIFQDHIQLFKKKGYKKVIQISHNPLHENYLKRIGFISEGNGVYSKTLN